MPLLLEYFKPYKDDYLASWSGKIINRHTGKPLKQRRLPKGYRMVTVKPFDGVLVHRVIASLFVTNPKPEEYTQVNHKYEDLDSPWANCADGLEWCTNWYNLHYGNGARRQAARERIIAERGKPVVLAKNGEVRRFRSIHEADRFLGRTRKMHEAIRDGAKSVYGWTIVSVGVNAA